MSYFYDQTSKREEKIQVSVLDFICSLVYYSDF